jgi:hypothetical protein
MQASSAAVYSSSHMYQNPPKSERRRSTSILEHSYQVSCGHGTFHASISVPGCEADGFMQFKDRFSFRRKGSRDAQAEGSDHSLLPPYTEQVTLRSPRGSIDESSEKRHGRSVPNLSSH